MHNELKILFLPRHPGKSILRKLIRKKIMAQNEVKEIDLDLLDRSIDDIEEMPSFDTPPVGTYQLLVNAATKMVAGKDEQGKSVDKPAVILDYEITGTVQLANRDLKEPVPGSKFGEMFFLGNEYSESNMKKALAPYAVHFGTNNLKDLIKEKIQNVIVTATVKHRFAKTDKAKETPFGTVVNVLIS